MAQRPSSRQLLARAATTLSVVASLLAASPPGAAPREAPSPRRAPEDSALPRSDTVSAGPPVAIDALLLGGGTVAYALAAPWIRPHFLEHFSLDRVGRNLSDPIGRLDVAEDDDGFFHNFVSHPVVWGGLGLVLRERGYGPWAALGMTQAHNVWWEYIVEGAWKPPSKVDVITNFVSPIVTIFAVHPLVEELGGEGATPDERTSPDGPNPRLRVLAVGRGVGVGLELSVP